MAKKRKVDKPSEVEGKDAEKERGDQLHTCRVSGPCWGCGCEIGEGHKYRKFQVENEYGNVPPRTVRLHPECYSIVKDFSLDEWNTFTPGDFAAIFDARDARSSAGTDQKAGAKE